MCLHFYMYKYNMDMNTRMKYSWNTVMSPDGDTRHVDDCYRERIEAAKGNSLSWRKIFFCIHALNILCYQHV